MALVLDPRVGLQVLATSASEVERHEELGCALQGPASRPVRRALAGLKARIGRLGKAKAIARAEELVRWLDDEPGYRALCTSKRRAGRRLLKESVLYPDARRQLPATLHVRIGLRAFEADLPPDAWPAAADAFAALAAGDEGAIRDAEAVPEVAEILGALAEAGLVFDGDPPPVPDPRALEGGILFLGHNTCLVATRHTRVLVDPWLRPVHDGDPRRYRPLVASQLVPVDAVLLTHAHGDHFHLGSLLHLPRSTPILVPDVPRETVLSTDLKLRLEQLGFSDVRRTPWWSETTIGDVKLAALPFYGEQATTTELVYPGLRNVGITWHVRTPQLSAAFLADSGTDPLGSMVTVAREARRRYGAVDVAFSGIRAFRIHPVLYPYTSLDAFLLNVPLDLAGVSQKLMCDPDDALDVAEALGARHLVPYADGGAPWYWREGMGPAYRGYPAYEGFREAPAASMDDPVSDPFPERLVDVARKRYGGDDGPVRPLLLRPGDLLHLRKGAPAIARLPGHGWIYRGR